MNPDSLASSPYFVWNGDPVLFETGVLQVPFTLSVYGLILGIVLAYFGSGWLLKRLQAKAPGKTKPQGLSDGQYWMLLIVALVVGQVVFNIIPVDGIQQVGPITFRWYGMLFGTAFFVGYLIGSKEFRDAGRPDNERDALLTYVLIATVVGARLGEVLFYDPGYYFSNPHLIPQIWRGGLASHGAAVGILVGIYLYTRRYRHMSYLWVTDRVVIPVAIGGAFVRLGNFFNSEIIGKPTEVPWAVIFVKEDWIPRHPTMLYESVLYVILFAVLWTIYKRWKGSPPEGYIFGVFLIIMFTGRFLLEYTKVDPADFTGGWPVSMGQLLSIPFVVLGVWLLWKKVDFRQARP